MCQDNKNYIRNSIKCPICGSKLNIVSDVVSIDCRCSFCTYTFESHFKNKDKTKLLTIRPSSKNDADIRKVGKEKFFKVIDTISIMGVSKQYLFMFSPQFVYFVKNNTGKMQGRWQIITYDRGNRFNQHEYYGHNKVDNSKIIKVLGEAYEDFNHNVKFSNTGKLNE